MAKKDDKNKETKEELKKKTTKSKTAKAAKKPKKTNTAKVKKDDGNQKEIKKQIKEVEKDKANEVEEKKFETSKGTVTVSTSKSKSKKDSLSEQNKKLMIICLLIFILILVVAVSIKSKRCKTCNISAPEVETVVKKEKLTQDEINQVARFIKKYENIGFLLTYYSNPKQVDLSTILYDGIDVGLVKLTENEKKEYLEATSKEEIFTKLYKVTTPQIKTFFKLKTGITLDQIKERMDNPDNNPKTKNWVYLSDYDAYYIEHGDTLYTEPTILEGYKEQNQYVVTIQTTVDSKEVKSVLKLNRKPDGEFLFYSNVKDNPLQTVINKNDLTEINELKEGNKALDPKDKIEKQEKEEKEIQKEIKQSTNEVKTKKSNRK